MKRLCFTSFLKTERRTEDLSGPPIIRSELEHAIKIAKLGKATGPDGISTEAIKLLEDENIDMLENVSNDIYNADHIVRN